MDQDLADCLLELYLNAMELLGASLQAMEGMEAQVSVRARLRSACIDAVLLSRSFAGSADAREMGWKVDQVGDRFRTAERLLRALHGSSRVSHPCIGAGIEIAERGADAALQGARILAERRSG